MADAAREAAEAALEPAAVDFSTNDEERVGLSIAISLKRIADVLDNNLGANAWCHEGTLNGILQQISNRSV